MNLYKLISVITTIAGSVALLGAWVATEKGTYFGFSSNKLYIDATNLLLAAIAFGVLALLEKRSSKES